MDSLNLKKEGNVDTSYLIRLFLNAAAGETPHVGASLVARLTEGTVAVFQDINKYLIDRFNGISESRSYSVSLRRSSDRLQLWSDGYGISSAASDEIFDRSCRLRGATLEILCSIGSTLTESLLGKTQLSESFTNKVENLRQLIQEAEDDLSKSESSTGSSEYDDDDIAQITADLEADTRSLMDLDSLFSEPIFDIEHARQPLDSSWHKWKPHEPYRQLIGKQFPKANEELVTSLGKANYERFLRGKEQRDKNFWAWCEDPKGPRLMHPSEIKGLEPTSSKFTDSGLGSSIPSSYAETIMSYHGGEGTSVRLPPLPRSSRGGFLCMACGRATAVENKSAWKRHLYNDLMPWQCLEPSCGHLGVFGTREDWVSHLALDHFGPEWKESECPLCRKDTGCGKTAILSHLGGHLEEISLAALPSNPDSDTESQPSNTSQQDKVAGSDAEEINSAAGIMVVECPPTHPDDTQIFEMTREGPVTLEEVADYLGEVMRQGPNFEDEFLHLLQNYEFDM
ncbi:hypothetical protein CABS03_12695 [Colletotrichum abscissum]|uniref:C2H2-type domain-containing protein n=1 Tax=Colletotrichum abscissum TaxID=1671311 RepID=A0A9P9XGD4_9PEZI|nr:hypothetical protein CABS02_06469 [Colletotrichum abscissum]